VFRSIRARLLATYVLTMLGIMGISGYLVYIFRDIYVTRARVDLRWWGTLMAGELSDSLAAGDEGRVREMVYRFDAGLASANGPKSEPYQTRVTLQVFDRTGRLIAGSHGARPVGSSWFELPGVRPAVERGQPVEDQLVGLRPEREYLYIAIPVVRERTLVGLVRMALYPARFELNLVRNALVATLAAGLALCLLINLIVAAGVGEPVRAMSSFAESIGRGRFGEHLSIRSQDEVGILAAQLNRMSDQLARSDQERREFLAAVSHELRTPVSNVQVTLESLLSGADDEPATRTRFLEAALSETQRLGNLVRDLIDLARLEAGVVTMRHREVRLAEIVRQLNAALESRLQERSIRLATEVPPDLHVWGDPDRLLQVLMNLVENAIKFVPEGSAIRVSAAADRQQTRIIVRDQGPGVPEEDLPYIFERFYTADKSRARGASGTGLGLAIAKRIVDSHSGGIAVRTPPEGGAEFTITLPRMWSRNAT
jgi:signal transduction histidine kinase